MSMLMIAMSLSKHSPKPVLSCTAKLVKNGNEYLQAMTVIQDDMFDSCNGLVKEQVDMLEEYADRGIVSKEYMLPVIGMANRFTIESYLDYVSLEYDLLLSRMQYHHKMLKMANDVAPRLMRTYLESIKPFKMFSF